MMEENNTTNQCDCFSTAGFIRLHKVLELVPVSKSSWWNGCKSGKYPQPYKLGDRTTAWKVEDVLKCMKNFKPTSHME